MLKRILAAFMAAALVVALAVPALALGSSSNGTEPKYQTPTGYNNNDYQKMVAFLEQTDENGVKNGKKLNNSYDPQAPNTWGNGIEWTNGEDKKLLRINAVNYGLVGILDLSGCNALRDLLCWDNSIVELDVTGCSVLDRFYCGGNALTELDVSTNTMLTELGCDGNALTELDVSHCTMLEWFGCEDNALTELDVSANEVLWRFSCYNNLLTELDLLNNRGILFDRISVVGSGTIGCGFYPMDEFATSAPDEGAEFLGWYSEDGTFISGEERLLLSESSYTCVVAHFTDSSEPTPTAEPTDAPVEPTDAPAEPTDAPAEPTDAPAEPTDAPVEPTDAPVEPTDAPAEPTNDPGTPSTGAVSIAAVGVIAVLSGAGIVLFRKK